MRKKILVDIYLAYNLGDDMFLDYLSKSYPDCDFIPYHPGTNYKGFYKKYSNIKQFSYTILDKILKRFTYDKLTDYKRLSKTYDGLIFLGGGIFREESYWKEVYQFRNSIIDAFVGLNKPVWFMGCNFGPYQTTNFLTKYKELFTKVNLINFRDYKSYGLFSELKNVNVYPDILWAYPLPNTVQQQNTLGISVINPKHKEGQSQFYDDYIKAHVRIISDHINRGYKIKLFSFCEAEGDLEICNQIKNQNPDVECYNYTGDITSYLEEIGSCSRFIASRFHANIIAIKYNIPLVPVIYGDKTENLLMDLGDADPYLYLNNISNLNSDIFRIYDRSFVNKIIQDSKKHIIKHPLFY